METDLNSLGHPTRHIERVIGNMLKIGYRNIVLHFQSFHFEPDNYEGEQYRDKESLPSVGMKTTPIRGVAFVHSLPVQLKRATT
jgi:hypothetical protein